MIDLRSDTVTRPTPGMRAAIAGAAVGDEQMREDPSVNELQERVAALLGQEQALFLPTATMANQIALKLHGRPGDVLVAEEHSHIVIYEFGGAAVHAGLLTVGLPGTAGRVTPAQVRAATDRGGCGRPASCRARDREHPQRRRGARVAARRSRRRRRWPPAPAVSACTSTERGC